MIKLIYCLTKKPELTREEFQEYWRNVHARLASGHGRTVKMVRYVQSHTYDSPMNDAMAEERGSPVGFDGVMEGWWESEEALREAVEADEGKSAMQELLDDEGKFIDFSRSPIFMTLEHEIYSDL